MARRITQRLFPALPEPPVAPMKSSLLEVPTDVWLDMRILPTLPRFVQLPRYDATQYDAEWPIAQPTLRDLEPLHGRAVRVKIGWGDQDGALFVDGDRVFWCTLAAGRKGAMRVDLAKLEWVGPLAHTKKSPNGERLAYADVVRAIQHRAVVARIDGATVDFELALDPRPRRTGIQSATDVLQLLARPLEDRNRWSIVGDAPLAVALRAEKLEPNLDELYCRSASRFVKSYQLDVTEAIAMPDLDALSRDEIRAALEQRVLAILRVELTDPAWAVHLHEVTAWMHLDERALPPPR